MAEPATNAIVRLADLKPGERGVFFALLTERSRQSTQRKGTFYSCKFRDQRRTVAAPIWPDRPYFADCDANWRAGQFFKVHATFSEHERYGPQIEIHQIRAVEARDEAEGFNRDEFGEHSRFDSKKMFAELRKLTEELIADDPLRKLTVGLLDRHADKLRILPASQKHYHPFAGGWLEHTLSVTRTAAWLCDHYKTHYETLRPPLNKDLVVAGSVLHEIGRVSELVAPEIPGDIPIKTIDGEFVGRLQLGRDLIRDAAREQGDLDPDLLRMLEHIVVCYLALPAWGSPRLPLIPEVLILHHADDLDAKLEMYARCLTRDVAGGAFTERDPILNQILYKAREV